MVNIPSRKAKADYGNKASLGEIYRNYYGVDSEQMVKDFDTMKAAGVIRVAKVGKGFMLFDAKEPNPNGKTAPEANQQAIAKIIDK